MTRTFHHRAPKAEVDYNKIVKKNYPETSARPTTVLVTGIKHSDHSIGPTIDLMVEDQDDFVLALLYAEDALELAKSLLKAIEYVKPELLNQAT